LKYAIYTVSLTLLLLLISGDRTWNHLFVQDPFIAELMKRAKDPSFITKIVDKAQEPLNAIVVGDSVMVSNFKSDADPRTLMEQITALLGDPVLPVARSGMPLSGHLEILELLTILNPPIRSKCLILEINPAQTTRHVNPQAYAAWQAHLNLVKQEFHPAERFFRYAIYLDQKMIGKPPPIRGPLKPFTIEDLLEKTFKASNQITEKIFCFITPANLARLKREMSIRSYEERLQLIARVEEICKAHGVACENWSALFPEESYFPDAGYVDLYRVHLNDKGRQILAQKIVSAIAK
jgi:hypothetical protein